MQVTTPINQGLGVNRKAIGAALIAIALAVVTAVGLAVVVSPAPETAIQPDLTSGFEHNSDATAGKALSGRITTQYFGYSGELYPEVSGPSVPDLTSGFEHNSDATTGKALSGRITTQYFGYNPELSPEVSGPSVPDQATIDLLVPAPPAEWFEKSPARSEWFDEPASEWNQ